MPLRDTLEEAQFVHCDKVEDWWEFNDKLEEMGCDRRYVWCQTCKYSALHYDATHGHTPRLVCRNFNMYVSDHDSCKYATDDGNITRLMREISDKETLSNDKHEISETASNNTRGCYIATAVYGSYDSPEVIILRRFRDNVLQRHWWGRLFVRIYYFVSPPIAKWLKNTTSINSFVRRILNWFVFMIKENYDEQIARKPQNIGCKKLQMPETKK